MIIFRKTGTFKRKSLHGAESLQRWGSNDATLVLELSLIAVSLEVQSLVHQKFTNQKMGLIISFIEVKAKLVLNLTYIL